MEHLVSHGTVDGVERRRLLKKSADLVDPETRFMDVTVWKDVQATSTLHIVVAGSDACVRYVIHSTQGVYGRSIRVIYFFTLRE